MMNRFFPGAMFGLMLGLTFGLGMIAMAQNMSVYPPVPVPLPQTMGGTGNTTGATATQSTVGGLPACNVSTKGQIWFVTDALLPALGVIVANGGAINVMVFCNGTNWVAG